MSEHLPPSSYQLDLPPRGPYGYTWRYVLPNSRWSRFWMRIRRRRGAFTIEPATEPGITVDFYIESWSIPGEPRERG